MLETCLWVQFFMLIPNIDSRKSSDVCHVTYDRFFIFFNSSHFFSRLLHPYKKSVTPGLLRFDLLVTWTVQENYWKFFNPCTTWSKIDFFKIFFRSFSEMLLFWHEGSKLWLYDSFIIKKNLISFNLIPSLSRSKVIKGVSLIPKV